jgi:hypothetical protein
MRIVSPKFRDTSSKGVSMPGIYKLIDVVGTSPNSFAEAARSAVVEAGKTVHHMSWFEVVEQRGAIKDGKVAEFQVTVRIGFKIDNH